MKSINSVSFWLNYFAMSVNGLSVFFFPCKFEANFYGKICFIIGYFLVIYFMKFLDHIELCLFRIINWTMVTGIGLYSLYTGESNKIFLILTFIITIIGFFGLLNNICKLIEMTNWYKNLERGRMLLMDKEERGKEPDPKDFE